ncbi:MAG: hypothetical protein WA160_10550 [Pseudobdellovibrio sp.]
MRFGLNIFLVILGFFSVTTSYANEESNKIVQFWLDGRFEHCDETVIINILSANSGTIAGLLASDCSKKSFKENPTKCFQKANSNLGINPNLNITKNFGCSEKLNYLDNFKTGLKIVTPKKIPPAGDVCALDSAPFKYKDAGKGHLSCVKEVKCRSDFHFGDSAKLSAGTYVFGCALTEKSLDSYEQAKDKSAAIKRICEDVNLVNCIPDSYHDTEILSTRKLNFVKPAAAGAAQ